jgi:hypothetical protein
VYSPVFCAPSFSLESALRAAFEAEDVAEREDAGGSDPAAPNPATSQASSAQPSAQTAPITSTPRGPVTRASKHEPSPQATYSHRRAGVTIEDVEDVDTPPPSGPAPAQRFFPSQPIDATLRTPKRKVDESPSEYAPPPVRLCQRAPLPRNGPDAPGSSTGHLPRKARVELLDPISNSDAPTLDPRIPTAPAPISKYASKKHRRQTYKRAMKSQGFVANSRKPQDRTAYVRKENTIEVPISLKDLPSNRGGYEASSKGAKGSRPRQLVMEDLLSEGYKLVKWDGRCVRLSTLAPPVLTYLQGIPSRHRLSYRQSLRCLCRASSRFIIHRCRPGRRRPHAQARPIERDHAR